MDYAEWVFLIAAICTILLAIFKFLKLFGKEPPANSKNVKQSIKSGKGSINIQSGGDVTVGDVKNDK